MQDHTGCKEPGKIKRCAGSAVVVERGGCSFMEKAQTLSAAHAAVMIVYNTEEGQHTMCWYCQLTHRSCMQELCSMPLQDVNVLCID